MKNGDTIFSKEFEERYFIYGLLANRNKAYLCNQNLGANIMSRRILVGRIKDLRQARMVLTEKVFTRKYSKQFYINDYIYDF